MKKITILFAIIGMMASNKVSASSHSTQFYAGSSTEPQINFCNRGVNGDSIPFYDISYASNGCKIVKWTWIFHGAVDSIFEFDSLNYKSVVYAKWLNAGVKSITLITQLRYDDGTDFYPYSTESITLVVSRVNILGSDTLYLDSTGIIKLQTSSQKSGGATFHWSLNGQEKKYGYLDSSFIANSIGIYSVRFVCEGWCTSYDKVVVLKKSIIDTTNTDTINKDTIIKHTGIDYFSYSKKEIKMYPNPANNVLNIEGTNELISIYDLSGKIMLTSNSSSIDISGIPTGMYIVSGLDFKGKKLLIFR